MGAQTLLSMVISIHAPREGSDNWGRDLIEGIGEISIHAPREGSDLSVPALLPPTV